MKKLILFISAIVLLLAVQAQDKSITLRPEQYYFAYTLNGAADTVSAAADSVYYVQMLTQKDMGLLYNVKTKITEVSGTAKIKVALEGKVHADDSWTKLNAAIYYGTGSDTTIVHSQTSTAQFYRYLRIKYTALSGSGKGKINTAAVKLWHL
jgi:hypothetical protein